MSISRKSSVKELLASLPDAETLSVGELWALVRKYETGDAALSDAMTLTEFYAKCYKPEVSDAKELKEDTYRQRQRALRYWGELTGDPPLCDIDKKTMVSFVQKLREVTYWTGEEWKKLSPWTIKKHCAALRSVLDYAGPKTEKNRDAKELIPMPPAWPPIQTYLNVTAKTPSHEEIEALIKATEVATTPKLPDITPQKWWECAYRLLALTGIRKGDLLGIKWEDVRLWEGMWCIVVPAEVEKTGMEKVIPLSTAAQDVLNEMPRGRPEDPIFQWSHCATTFYRQRRKIIRQAKIARYIRGTWHAIRRYVGTMVPDAQLVLGHTTDAVTRRHYQSMTRAAEALEAYGEKMII